MGLPRRGGDARNTTLFKNLIQLSPFLPFLLAIFCLTSLTEYRVRRSFQIQLDSLNATLVGVESSNRKSLRKLFARQKNNKYLLHGEFDHKHDSLRRELNSLETRNLRSQRFAFQREFANLKKSAKFGKFGGVNGDIKRRQEMIWRYHHMLNSEVRRMKQKISIIESRYSETLRKFYRMETNDAKRLNDALRIEFQRMNSTLLDIEASESKVLENATCVLIGTSGRNYKYKHSWIMNRLVEKKIPYIHFSIGTIVPKRRRLPQHYGRILALMAAHKTLPGVKTFVYSDIDTLLDFEKACTINDQPLVKKDNAMVISFKNSWHNSKIKVLRTNWFVIRPHLLNGIRLLKFWLKKARDVKLQDQTIFNEIYSARDNNCLLDVGVS